MIAAGFVDRRDVDGRIDVIGDLHGCLDELADLFHRLGYVPDTTEGFRSPDGRLPVFVGDFVDRGPANVGVLRLAMQMVTSGAALAVPGNHDIQLQRYLAGEAVPLVWGLAETVAELEREPESFRREVLEFIGSLPGHLVLDGGALVVAHTGLAEAFHLDDSPRARLLAAYGVVDGDMDPGDPERRHAWVADYRGAAAVVYGHTPVAEPVWRNRAIDIDTGCVYGWRLTALRWPERTLDFVRAHRQYVRPGRRFYPGA
jgi:protein phosphatase